MSIATHVPMEGGSNEGCAKLTTIEKTAVAAAVTAVLFRCQQERALGKMRVQIRAQRRKTLHQVPVEGLDTVAITKAAVQVCCAKGCNVLPRATPRWWMKRRKGGAWEDFGQCDDATEEHFWEKLCMSPRVFRAMAIASSVDERPRDALPMSMSTAVGADPSSSLLEDFDRGRPSMIEEAHVGQEDHDKQNCDYEQQ
ncbi:hypothetical protein CBR_g36885 [Chara braunii]|uniref:Uncharacterized protein n=1 Tax=Chara braunii TaxID=69332 RepID=A0A388LLR3_CHABU|nr:hypothetical protein CBR_g36885 [Chara braunii]|eukprot:GBG83270.1 hypothetical protein CBR_g36885 [Chara braunii]